MICNQLGNGLVSLLAKSMVNFKNKVLLIKNGRKYGIITRKLAVVLA